MDNIEKLIEESIFTECKISNNKLKMQGKKTRRGKENKEYRELCDIQSLYMKTKHLKISLIPRIPIRLMHLSLKTVTELKKEAIL